MILLAVGTFSSSQWFVSLIDKAVPVFSMQHCYSRGPGSLQVNKHSDASSQRNRSLWSGWAEHCQVPPTAGGVSTAGVTS